MKKLLFLVCVVMTAGIAAAQAVGDHTTAGYNGSRTYLNSDQGNFAPPLELFQTVDLPNNGTNSSLIVFTNQGTRILLVGSSNETSVTFTAVDEETGDVLWTSGLAGVETLDYVPAYSDNIVILGGPATTTVKAVRVSDGTELWQDTSVGETTGRYPLNAPGLTVYAGLNKIVATDPAAGPSPSFWEFATTTAEAPLSAWGNRVYALDGSGTLRAFQSDTGTQIWARAGVGTEADNIIATEHLVYTNFNGENMGIIRALSTVDGSTVWSAPTPLLSEHPSMALAYGQLIAFAPVSSTGNALVAALNPDTGQVLWTAEEAGPGMEYALVANNRIYYYQPDSERLRVRNAFNGRLVGGFAIPGVRGISASGGQLYLLFDDRIEIYRSVYELIFAQLADGGGQQTIITLSNAGVNPVIASISLFAPDGTPLPIGPSPLGDGSVIEVTVPAQETIQFMSAGGETPTAGWASVVSDGPLSGNAVYQFIGANNEILNEAGVAASAPTGLATGLAIIERPPTRPQVISTAIAIANPFNKDANIEFTLIDADGTEVGTATLMLGAGTQTAQFLDQIFDFGALLGDPNAEFIGSVTIRSDVPIAVTALRTQGGLQLSSYDFGQ